MPPRLDRLAHIVALMMENRSFDHMLGSLKAANSQIDGITDQLRNPDTTGAQIKPAALAEFQGQLDLDPDYQFPAVDLQIFGRDSNRAFAHYGNEGNHTIFNVNTALLGGAARPSLY